MSEDLTRAFPRRQFLTQTAYLATGYSIASAFPFPALSSSLGDDPRISQTPVVDAGFASVRKIGDGVYATISDPSKGLSTMCNGGFLFGKDAALLVEGFVTAAGAAFQMDAMRKVSQTPAVGALDTHYHYDHSLGNSFYGANGIQLWGHAALPHRITESYGGMQATERTTFLAPFEKRVNEAKSEAQKQHADGDLRMFGNIFDFVRKSPLTLPNRLLDPATLPLNVDLGHFPIAVEAYPGHSGTDLIIRVPEQKVVYAGDLVFSGSYPATFDEKASVSGGAPHSRPLPLGTKTRSLSPATVPYAARKVFSGCVMYSMTCPSKPKKCTRRACLRPRPATNMSSPTNIRALPCFPGASVFGPPFQSFTPSFKANRCASPDASRFCGQN